MNYGSLGLTIGIPQCFLHNGNLYFKKNFEENAFQAILGSFPFISA